jgi:hypothetical protein
MKDWRYSSQDPTAVAIPNAKIHPPIPVRLGWNRWMALNSKVPSGVYSIVWNTLSIWGNKVIPGIGLGWEEIQKMQPT